MEKGLTKLDETPVRRARYPGNANSRPYPGDRSRNDSPASRDWLPVPPISALKMHSIASGDPVQTCESDSRSTASSPTTLPTEEAESPAPAPVRPASRAIGQAVAPVAISWRLAWLSQ